MLWHRPIMPLDNETVAEVQEANSRHVQILREKNPDWTYHEVAALAMKRAISERGYDPDKSLQWWMSPDFRDNLYRDHPREALHWQRLADSLLAVALGDGATDEEFNRIIRQYSSALQATATARRLAKTTP